MIPDGRDRMMKALADRPLGHACCVCGARAPFGLSAPNAGPQAARWFCMEHALPHFKALQDDRAQPKTSGPAIETRAAPAPATKQGRLL